MKNYERLEKEVKDRLLAFIDKYNEVTNYTYKKEHIGSHSIVTLKEGCKPVLGRGTYKPYVANTLFSKITPFGFDLLPNRC